MIPCVQQLITATNTRGPVRQMKYVYTTYTVTVAHRWTTQIEQCDNDNCSWKNKPYYPELSIFKQHRIHVDNVMSAQMLPS